MLRKLLDREEAGAALVLALSGAVVVLVSKGDGPPSLGRVVTGVLSNPVPGAAQATRSSSVTTPHQHSTA